MLFFPVGGRGRYQHRLAHAPLEFFKLQRAIVQGAGQPEAIFHQRGLARAVAQIHGTKLADRDVALVHKHQGIFGHVIGQRRGRISRRTACQMARVVFNALAVADFGEHFKVKPRALLHALCLDQLALGHKELDALGQFHLDGLHCRHHLFPRRDVMAAGVHREAWNLLADAARERVEKLERFNLIVKQLQADRHLAVFGREDVNRVPAHPESPARKINVIALVLHADQLGNHVALAGFVAHPQRHDHLVVRLRLANAVNGRHRGHDHHIAPFQNAFGAA